MNQPIYILLEECMTNINSAKHHSRKIRQFGSMPKRTIQCSTRFKETNIKADEEIKSVNAAKNPAINESELVEGILKDFANKVGRWRQMKVKTPDSEHFATYLNDEFLCRQLDPLPRGKFVSIARKAISLEIEKISKIRNSDKTSNQPVDRNKRASKIIHSLFDSEEKTPINNNDAKMAANSLEALLAQCETQQEQLMSLRN